jgi:hypothetical protein
VVEWIAYADETGTHEGSEFCAVLGYVASPRQWKLFKRDWRRALGSIPEFHAVDFFQRASWQSEDSPYNDWSDKKARRFLNRLLGTIDRHDVRPIGFGYNVADFMALTLDERRRLTGATRKTRTRVAKGKSVVTDRLISSGAPTEPYFLGFHYVITEALKAAPRGATINYVFDRRKTREALAFQTFGEIKEYAKNPALDRVGLLSFGDSDKHEPLQAADLYAYAINRRLRGSTPDLVELALDRLGRKRNTMSIANASTFQELLAGQDRDRQAGIDNAVRGDGSEPSPS